MLPGITTEHGLTQVLPDGTRLNADVYAPGAPGRYPTLLMRLPYGAEIASAGVYRHPAWYATQGFQVVVQEVRGCGSSAGTFYPLRDEQADTLAAIEWAAALPRANGKLAMYGFSYQGAVQLQAAAAGHPALACIAPAQTGADFYNGWHYEGGVPLYGGMLGWALQLATIAARHDGRDADVQQLRSAAAGMDALYASVPPLPPLLSEVPFARDWFEHESDDAYWKAQQSAPAPALPGLWIAGWYDTYLAGTLAAHGAACTPGAAEQSIIIGPWQHLPWAPAVGARDFGPAAWSPVDALQVSFFDTYLRGCSPQPAGAVAFVTGSNRWRPFSAWPPPQAAVAQLLLDSDGDAAGYPGGVLRPEAAAVDRFDALVSEPLTPVPSLGGHGGGAGRAPAVGCFDQSPVEQRREVLTYTTPPLERDTLVAGPITASLHVAAGTADCDWVARLCDVDEQGRSYNVTQGALRSRYRNGFAQAEALTPDTPEQLAVGMRQCCHLFKAGHRIRLSVAGSSFPHYARNPGVCEPVYGLPASAYRAAVQYVLHGPSHPSALQLPLLDLEAGEPWQPPLIDTSP